MKVFVTGSCGQLGRDCVDDLISKGHSVIGSDIYDQFHDNGPAIESADFQYLPLDITDRETVFDVIHQVKPDAVIHCAAWTAVDAAEDPDNKEKVFLINSYGTRNIAMAVKDINAKMIYISTDYVFDGHGSAPWDPDCKDYHPLNTYGQSKLEGEAAVSGLLEKYFIVRIAWVFGKNGNNFVKTILRAGKTHASVCVVNDQVGTPTYTKDLAPLLTEMLRTEKYGYYHATNSEENPGEFISWYDFTKEIYAQAGLKTEVIPVTTAEYGLSKASRPFNSRLNKDKLIKEGFKPLPGWKDALRRCLLETKEI